MIFLLGLLSEIQILYCLIPVPRDLLLIPLLEIPVDHSLLVSRELQILLLLLAELPALMFLFPRQKTWLVLPPHLHACRS